MAQIPSQIRASRCPQRNSAGQRKRPACESSRSHPLPSANPRAVTAVGLSSLLQEIQKVHWQLVLLICSSHQPLMHYARGAASAGGISWPSLKCLGLADNVEFTLRPT